MKGWDDFENYDLFCLRLICISVLKHYTGASVAVSDGIIVSWRHVVTASAIRKLLSESWRKKVGVRKLASASWHQKVDIRKLTSESWRKKVGVRKVVSTNHSRKGVSVSVSLNCVSGDSVSLSCTYVGHDPAHVY